MFLTNLRIFKAIGTGWADIYDSLLKMQSVTPSLLRITQMMNLPVDDHQTMQLSRDMEKQTILKKQMVMGTANIQPGYEVDALHISASNVSFKYQCALWDDGASIDSNGGSAGGLRQCNFEIP